MGVFFFPQTCNVHYPIGGVCLIFFRRRTSGATIDLLSFLIAILEAETFVFLYQRSKHKQVDLHFQVK